MVKFAFTSQSSTKLRDRVPRQFLEGQFALRSSNDIGFAVPRYDHTKALIIDPVVTYSTYLGGGDDEGIFGIKQDASGKFYVAGETSSIDSLNVSATQRSYGGGEYDGFVSKFDPTGAQLIYSQSLDFPVARGVIQPACGINPGARSCSGDALVTR